MSTIRSGTTAMSTSPRCNAAMWRVSTGAISSLWVPETPLTALTCCFLAGAGSA
jgi:hypothetical protein